MVFIKGFILPSASSGSGTTQLRISGLPYTSINNYSQYSAGTLLVEGSDNFFSGIPTLRTNANSTQLTVYNVIAGSTVTTLFDITRMDSNDEYEFSAMYQV